MTTQVRNDQMVSLLEPDFLTRNEPAPYLGKALSMYLALPALRAFWPFSSVNESGNVYDISGQARTLTNTNTVTFGVTDFLQYADFDGSTNYFTRADEAGLDITGSITFGCWIYFDGAAGSNETIINKWYTAGNNRSYMLRRIAAGNVTLFLSVDGSANVSVNSTSTTSATTWYFVAGRLEASTETSVFLNDEKTDLGSGIAGIYAGTAPLEFGFRESGTYLDGRMALAFLCDTNLSDALLSNLYQQTRILFGV